jgi:hypothetical protein
MAAFCEKRGGQRRQGITVSQITETIFRIFEDARVNIEIRIDENRILAGNARHLLFTPIFPDQKIVG